MKILNQYVIAIFILVFTFITGCSRGKLNKTPETNPIEITQKILVDYSATQAFVNIQGQVINNVYQNLDQLQFYLGADCSGPIVGSSLVSDFVSSGTTITAPINQPITLYFNTASNENCFLVETFNHGVAQPSSPSFGSISPESPSRNSNTPGVFGSIFPPSGTIEIHSNSSCTNLLQTGSGSDFTSVGLELTLPTEATTNIYGITRDVLGNSSTCILLSQFTHTTALSASPVLVNFSPTSPSNTSHEPKVIGTVSPGTVSVGLYEDSGCNQLLVEGDPADFTTTGLDVSLTNNGTQSVYAKTIDNQNNPSSCVFFGDFTHDDVSPGDPVYSGVTPPSPTNATTQPVISGTSSADTTQIYFYDSPACAGNALSFGDKSVFEGSGIAVGISADDTTSIYAKALDGAGNDSSCVFFLDYTHNTNAPGDPVFITSSPTSPNNSDINPFLIGSADFRTTVLTFYSDAICSTQIGQGTKATYESSGVQVSLSANTENFIYVSVRDVEGNDSPCTFHATYDHSTAAAPNPVFSATFPPSPSNSSNTPGILGTAANTLVTINLFDDAVCGNQIASGTRGQFVSSGIGALLPLNSTTDIYAQAIDIYGNDSACVLMTQYIHTNVAPFAPTYTTTTPLSPNNSSTSPTIFGDVFANPASQLPPTNVAFYDSAICINKLGEGNPVDYNPSGININVAPNVINSIYGRVFDDAGNFSACTYLTDYTHNSYAPGNPVYGSANPASPSYSEDVVFSGSYSATLDFMNRVAINFYTDAACSSLLATGNPDLYNGAGFPIEMPLNSITTLYAQSVNEVGTLSACQLQTNYRHYDLPPSNLNLTNNPNGSVRVTWSGETIPSPQAKYTLERSLNINGPYTVLTSAQSGTSFVDNFITNSTEYFYRIHGTNTTGRSQNSVPVSIVTAAPPAVTAINLTANGIDGRVDLNWSGFPQNMTYKLARSTNYAGPFSDLGINTLNTSYQDYTTTNGTTYYYIVTASNPSGLSMQSDVASAVPLSVSPKVTNFNMVPVNSMPECNGANGAYFTWTAPSYSNTMRVLYGSFKSSTAVAASVNEAKRFICNLPGGDVYYYKAATEWGGNLSPLSDEVFGILSSSTTVVSVDPGNNEILISWNSPAKNADISTYSLVYDLYSSDAYDGPYNKIGDAIGTNNFTEAVPNGEGRYYYVQAYVIDSAGDKIFVGYPSAIKGGTADIDPGIPTNLVLSEDTSVSRINLNWTPPTNYNGFNVYHATSLGGPYSISKNVTSTYDLNATKVTGLNYYKITSVWGNFESGDSNIVSFRSAPITGISETATASDITINWDSVAGVSDYIVLRDTNINGTYSTQFVAATNSYTDATAVAGVGYYYKVYARFADTTQGELSPAIGSMLIDGLAPVSVSLTVLGTTNMRVDWPEVNSVGQYRVDLATSAGGPFVTQGIVSNNLFNLLGLTPQTEYFVRVSSIVGLNTHTSSVVSDWTYRLANTPSGSPGSNEINVTWSSHSGANHYDLQRSSDGVTFVTIADDYAGTSFLDSGVTNGNIYFYRLVVNYPTVSKESKNSLGITPGLIPFAPTQLSAENNNTGTEVLLSWSQISGANNYSIYRSTTPGVYGAPIQNTSSNIEVRVNGLTNGTTYYFKVTALNGTNESADSNEIAIVPTMNPAKPDAIYQSSTDVSITWAAVPGANKYELSRTTDGVEYTVIAPALLTTSFVDTIPIIETDKTYYYRYRGYNDSSSPTVEMSLSAISDGVSLSVEPLVPIGFTATMLNNTEVNLEWTFTPTISGVEILRSATTGGPYSLVGTAGPTDITYVDNTIVAGSDYFYVIRSLSPSGVPSANSVEQAVSVTSGPTGLIASNGLSTIDLNWDVLAGVSSYVVKRSLASGGPYGEVANPATNSYADSDIVSDITYYYVVEGQFADGRRTIQSLEVSLNKSGFIDLQVPVELTDMSLASSSAGDVAFERTLTSLNTDYYDGVSSYEFEIVATNNDASAKNISLLDEADISIGSVSIPAGTIDPTRFKAFVVPNAGDDLYRINIESTASDNDVEIYSAKLLINQTAATKTRLYYPLLSSDQAPSNEDDTAFIHSTALETYEEFNNTLVYERKASLLNTIIDYNAWELEALVSRDGMVEGSFAFRNISTNQIIDFTETRFDGDNIQMASVPFDEGLPDFGENNGNENDLYRLDFKCEFECDTGEARIYKAGLWVTLENLSSARVAHRLTSYNEGISAATDFTDQRSLIELGNYSTPKVYLQAFIEDDGATNGTLDLIYSPDESGGANISPVVGSSIVFDADDLAHYTSPELTILTGNKFMTRAIPAAGAFVLRSSFIVIDVDNTP